MAIEARHSARSRLALRAATAAAIVVAGLPMFPLSLPILPLPAYMAYERAIGLSRPAPPDGKSHLINPMFADQLGWNTMTQTVAGAYWSLPAEATQGNRHLRRPLRIRRRARLLRAALRLADGHQPKQLLLSLGNARL